jgi:hypothetical protein
MWDERIDEVARELTAGRVPDRLRANVLARIDKGSTTSAWGVWQMIAVPALVVVFALVMSSLVRHSGQRPPSPKLARQHTQQTVGDRDLPAPAWSVAATTARPSSTVRYAARRRPPSVSTGADDLRLEPMTIAPVRLPALEVAAPAEPEPLGVAPLTLTPLASEGR